MPPRLRDDLVIHEASVDGSFAAGTPGWTVDVKLGIGMENEPYDAIGRGELNIYCLPILRDDNGPFGSPTSDSVRTMVVPGTKRFLMVLFDFGGDGNVEEVLKKAGEYYRKYADVKEGVVNIVEM